MAALQLEGLSIPEERPLSVLAQIEVPRPASRPGSLLRPPRLRVARAVGVVGVFQEARLRAKLQNGWREPRYVATVPGRGYRFLPQSTDGRGAPTDTPGSDAERPQT